MNKSSRLFALCLLLSGCYYNKEETLNDVCSTGNISYSATILPIINSKGCLSCHSGPSPLAPFTLDSYNAVKAKATEIRNGTPILYGALAHLRGFVPMPENAPMLSTCDVAKIKAWIDAGTPQ